MLARGCPDFCLIRVTLPPLRFATHTSPAAAVMAVGDLPAGIGAPTTLPAFFAPPPPPSIAAIPTPTRARTTTPAATTTPGRRHAGRSFTAPAVAAARVAPASAWCVVAATVAPASVEPGAAAPRATLRSPAATVRPWLAARAARPRSPADG